MSKKSPDTLIVAHRGAMDEAPENTMAAFRAALRHGVDGIELDVQMTADGVLVLYHDTTTRRIGGESRPVGGYGHAELCKLQWREWRGAEIPAVPLATLEQAVTELVGQTRLLVEIKSFPGDRRSGRAIELTRRVLDLLASIVPPDRNDAVFILSFDVDVLAAARDHPWALVLNLEAPAQARVPAWTSACCAAIERLDAPTAATWRKAGKRVMTYSCNTPAQMVTANALHCDVIMTDRPGWAVRYQRTAKPE